MLSSSASGESGTSGSPERPWPGASGARMRRLSGRRRAMTAANGAADVAMPCSITTGCSEPAPGVS